jgi:hypothetical protein
VTTTVEAEEESRSVKHARVLRRWLLGVAITLALVVAGVYFAKFGGGLNSDQQVWGQFGDYVGGLLNPVFAFLALIGFLATLIIQTQELDLTRKELKKSSEALKSQHEATSRQVEAFLTSERAYVFAEVVLGNISAGSLGADPALKVWGTVKFWNYGKTAAVVTLIRGYMTLEADVPHELLAGAGTEKQLPASLAIATNTTHPEELIITLSRADVADMKDLRKRLYVVGKIEYNTVHGASCVTGFCWHVVYRENAGSVVTITRDSRLNVRT